MCEIMIFKLFWSVFATILSFYGLKTEADILARQDGCDSAVRRPRFLSKTIFFNFSNPSFGWKVTSRHFCQKLNFYRGFKRNRLGQNVRNDRGIVSDFYKKCDFDMRVAGQSPCFPENLDSHFLCLTSWFLFGGQTCEALIFLEYRI